jgi:hypothetical protein
MHSIERFEAAMVSDAVGIVWGGLGSGSGIALLSIVVVVGCRVSVVVVVGGLINHLYVRM